MLLRAILTRILAIVCLVMLRVDSLWAADPDLELGEYLAGECTTCHREDSVNQGIPSIFGLPSVVFIEALSQYRDGTRINQAMRGVARSLNDEETAALAAYLEQASPYKQ